MKGLNLEMPIFLLGIAFALLLAAMLLVLLRFRAKRMEQVFRKEHLIRMGISSSFSTLKTRYLFLVFSLVMFSIALANLQLPGKEAEVEQKGSDVVIALDISRSMLVRDVAPDRLSRAVRFSAGLLEQIRGDRVGLVFFAGSAYIQMPLSTDFAAANLFLRNAHPDLISNQGTSIGDALELSLAVLDQDVPHGKTIVLISDGEDHDPLSLEKVREVTTRGIQIIAIGVGTAAGGVVPFESSGFRRQAEEGVIVSKFNAANLKQIAEMNGGSYYELGPDQQTTIESVVSEIGNMEKGAFTMHLIKEYDHMFQYFILAGLLFYAMYMIWPYPYRTYLIANNQTGRDNPVSNIS